MGLAHSPSVVTNGLVFYYDANNSQKSWKGAPTTNLLPLSALASLNASREIYQGRFKGIYSGYQAVGVSNDNPRTFLFAGSLSVLANTFYTFSCLYWSSNSINDDIYIKFSDTGWPESTYYIQPISSQSATRNGSFSITTLGDGWNYLVGTFQTLATTTTLEQLFFDVDEAGVTVFIANIQLEQNTFATPYVNGTRSNTQAIIDLVNNNTITTSSLSYNLNGTFSFNGTNNYLTIPVSSALNVPNTFTLDAWINPSSYTGDIIILGQGSYYLTMNSSYQLSVYCYGKNPEGYHTTTETLTQNTWNHICASWSTTEVSLYINGQLKKSVSTSGTPNSVNTQVWIGSEYNGTQRSFNGQISSAKIYNKSLTATEVQQNFNAQRGLYGL